MKTMKGYVVVDVNFPLCLYPSELSSAFGSLKAAKKYKKSRTKERLKIVKCDVVIKEV